MSTEQADYETKVRQTIKHHLESLGHDLDNFLQTTHATLAGREIIDVTNGLLMAYQRPSSYTVSDLRQVIDRFVREAKV